MKRTGRWQDWAILILGAWLLLSPSILGDAAWAVAVRPPESRTPQA